MASSLDKVDEDHFKILDDGPLHGSAISLKNSNIIVNDHNVLLSEVPDNIIVTPSRYTTRDKQVITTTPGCFVGFETPEAKAHHVVPIGKLKDIKFKSIFRFKIWWTTHWTGTNGSDLEHETQMVILDKSDSSGRPYLLLLPLIEGPFRASLQPENDDYIDICVESGSSKVTGDSFQSVLYMHAGIQRSEKELICTRLERRRANRGSIQPVCHQKHATHAHNMETQSIQPWRGAPQAVPIQHFPIQLGLAYGEGLSVYFV